VLAAMTRNTERSRRRGWYASAVTEADAEAQTP
jgi:hypothetical protein